MEIQTRRFFGQAGESPRSTRGQGVGGALREALQDGGKSLRFHRALQVRYPVQGICPGSFQRGDGEPDTVIFRRPRALSVALDGSGAARSLLFRSRRASSASSRAAGPFRIARWSLRSADIRPVQE